MAAEWTHVITNLSADELEASENGNGSSDNGLPISSPRTSLVTFDPKIGHYWVIISIYCKANSSDSIPKLRPYFYDELQSEVLTKLLETDTEFWGKGDLIFRKDSSGNDVKTPNGTTEKYLLAPIYIGNYRTRFALEACETGADLIIVIDRVAIEQLPSY
jgi:hypothetical protein